ncbi:transglycosylase SLT domain-containing protein, partial [uncultured Vibrio sp.]
MQINTTNLRAYKVSMEDMFDPCQNITVGSKILYEGYQRALRINSEPDMALKIALSYYNTG